MYNVVSRIYVEDALAVVYEDMDITQEEALQAVSYCKELDCIEDDTLVYYCTGCILSDLVDKEETPKQLKLLRETALKEHLLGLLHEGDDLREEIRLGWQLAQDVHRKFFSHASSSTSRRSGLPR